MLICFVGNIEARDGFTSLMQALARAGLATEVRNGDNCCLLVFVKVGSEKRFAQEVYRSRYSTSSAYAPDLH